MAPQRQLEIELDLLEDDLRDGSLSDAEYDRAVKELHIDYQGYAQEAAQEAYVAELDRW